MAKRYYWLKLSEDFFSETCIKALRRLPSGDSLVIVYLKMQLKSLKTEGLLKYCGLLPDSTAELAMALLTWTISSEESAISSWVLMPRQERNAHLT